MAISVMSIFRAASRMVARFNAISPSSFVAEGSMGAGWTGENSEPKGLTRSAVEARPLPGRDTTERRRALPRPSCRRKASQSSNFGLSARASSMKGM